MKGLPGLAQLQRLGHRVENVETRASKPRISGIVVRPPVISREEWEADNGPLDLDVYRSQLRAAYADETPSDHPAVGSVIVRPPICDEMAMAEQEVRDEFEQKRNAVYLGKGR